MSALRTWWRWPLPGWTRFPICLFIGVRLALFAFGGYALELVPSLYRSDVLAAKTTGSLGLDAFCRWDCAHYYAIALGGYPRPVDTNMWPLFALFGRALHTLIPMSLTAALLLVANLASLGAYLVIYRLFTELEDERAARSALVLLAAYPFGYFQAAGYPESLLVFATALSCWLALRGRPVWAGLVVGIGSLARHLVILAAPSLLAAEVDRDGKRSLRWLRLLFGLLLCTVGFAAYAVFCQLRFGDPLAFVHARHLWGGGAEAKISTTFLDRLGRSYFFAASIPFAGAVALLAKRRWRVLAPFALLYLGVCVGLSPWGLGRYSGSAWAGFLPLGAWLSRRPALEAPVVAGLALFQGLFLFLSVHQYWIL